MDKNEEIQICYIGEEAVVQEQVVQLLGRCFPDYWEQLARKNGGFPFRELSFVALDARKQVQGHVGLLPFQAAGLDGRLLKFAGLASVAVAPECRGRGLAAKLCRAAAEWASAEGYDALPLFTSLTRVYASVGWTDYPIAGACRLLPPEWFSGRGLALRSGMALSMEEKSRISALYDAAPVFPGKVVRGNGRGFHDWPRIFRDRDIAFAVSSRGYALFYDGALAEINGASGCGAELLTGFSSALNIAFPPEHPLVQKLLQDGWRLDGTLSPDVWHGEHVMNRNAAGTLPPGIAFPLADKF